MHALRSLKWERCNQLHLRVLQGGERVADGGVGDGLPDPLPHLLRVLLPHRRITALDLSEHGRGNRPRPRLDHLGVVTQRLDEDRRLLDLAVGRQPFDHQPHLLGHRPEA